jgi:hypothetical protein
MKIIGPKGRLKVMLGALGLTLVICFFSACPDWSSICSLFDGSQSGPHVKKEPLRDISDDGSDAGRLPLRGTPAVGIPASNAQQTSGGTEGVNIDTQKILDMPGITNSIVVARNADTDLSPSHLGHPGYENLAFLYDKAVDALVLKAAGSQKEAEDVLDYFAARLFIPRDEVKARADTNEVYGIMKLFKYKGSGRRPVKAVINALDITSLKRQGKGELEFHTTPGPTSFMIFAMLIVNPEKYKFYAITLGEVLLAMQDRDGGIRDGDRAPDKIHTEPHVDGCAALYMLYDITGDDKWRIAADKGVKWFKRNVYHPREGTIDQGLWAGKENKIFAEDVYSWTMAGPVGDKIPLDILKKLTDTVLRKSLVKITVSLPDGNTRTLTLVDFTDPQDEDVKKVRKGFHPMGSVEWTGGAILGLQKNAVRFWDAGDKEAAGFYKAMAEILMGEAMRSFYYLDDVKGRVTFYGTGQGVEIAPFGSIESGLSSGWKTPYYYVKTAEGTTLVKGGSFVGAWPILPYVGINPFILNDKYRQTYDVIPHSEADIKKAQDYFDSILANRSYTEEVPVQAPESGTQIVEPGVFTAKMWAAFETAYLAKDHENYVEAQAGFKEALKWAEKVVDNPTWVKLAKRDNEMKEKEAGGIIAYPWGQVIPDNNSELHLAILRYPILNEMGASMWGLATANFELGNYTDSKYWMKQLIESFPMHQIPVTEEGAAYQGNNMIKGYWNALVSWEDSVGGTDRDSQMGVLYRQVLKEMGRETAKPKLIILPDKE